MCLACGIPLILWDFRGTGIAISLELEKSYKDQLTDKMRTFSGHFLKMSLSLRNPCLKEKTKIHPVGVSARSEKQQDIGAGAVIT